MNPTSTNPLSTDDPLSDVVPFLDLPQRYPQFFGAKNAAAWLLRQRETNGLAEHIRWVGRTAYIGLTDFASWFRSRSSPAPRSEAQRSASARNVTVARAARLRREHRPAPSGG